MDIPPNIGEETHRPECPRRMYSTLVASRLFWRDEGTGIAKGLTGVVVEEEGDATTKLTCYLFHSRTNCLLLYCYKRTLGWIIESLKLEGKVSNADAVDNESNGSISTPDCGMAVRCI